MKFRICQLIFIIPVIIIGSVLPFGVSTILEFRQTRKIGSKAVTEAALEMETHAEQEMNNEEDEQSLNDLAIAEINSLRRQHQLSDAPIIYEKSLKDLAKTCAMMYRLQKTALTSKRVISHKDFEDQCYDVNGGNEIIFHIDSQPTMDPLAVSKFFQTLYMAGEKTYNNYLEPTTVVAEAQQIYTQLLWKDSNRMGCACDPKVHVPKNDAAKIPNDLYICSCIFNPAGNIRKGYGNAGLEAYVLNVLPKV